MIFTKACGAGVWTGNKRHLGTKTGWKVKEAVESGAWEGWKHNRNCVGRMTSKPPSAKRRSCHACHGANCAPQPGPAKPRGGPGRRAVCHQAGKVSREPRDRWQQTCTTAWSAAVTFLVLLASASQASHTVIPRALTNPQLCRRGNSGRHNLILAKGTQHKFTTRSFNNYQHFHCYLFLLSHPFSFFWLTKYFKANLRCFNS